MAATLAAFAYSHLFMLYVGAGGFVPGLWVGFVLVGGVGQAYSLVVKRFVPVLLILIVSAAAGGQSSPVPLDGCRKELKVDEFLVPEDANLAKSTFEKFRSALLGGNREQVVGLMRFPADLVFNGRGHRFDSPREFRGSYEKVFTRYVIDSVRDQKAEELLGGWNGVQLSNHAVSFTRGEDGEFRVSNVIPKVVPVPDFMAPYQDHQLTCPPVVIEGRIVAYDWVTHMFPGFESIYVDHFIVEVTGIVSGKLAARRIRVDFWGVSHLPDYNLSPKAFEAGPVWRMYLRPADGPSSNQEVCTQDVQESIAGVDEAGRELRRDSAITVIAGEGTPTFVGLPCFEVRKQFLSAAGSQVSRR